MAAEVRDVDDLKRVLEEDARFKPYSVTGTGPGWLEIRAGAVGITFATAAIFRDQEAIEPHLVRSHEGKTMLVLLGAEDDFAGVEDLRDQVELAVVGMPVSRARLYVSIKNYVELMALRARDLERGRVTERYKYELSELIEIARAISSERDIDKLLGVILERSRQITGADAGSVYVVEGRGLNPRERTLRFTVTQNDSVTIELKEHALPVDEKTVVGRAVISRQVINIADLSQTDYDRRMDRKTGYQTRSMLTLPMVNQRDEVIGVIQLINCRKDGAPKLLSPGDFDTFVQPFDRRAEELASTLASQAGISLENTLLYEDIRRMFEGFVNAAVTAIESRDPTTSGHSQRVATLTVGLAEVVDRADGAYRNLHFTSDDLKEIEYAALLHDFGKVGVREKVLVKAKKLYEADRDLLLARFDYIRKSLEADAYKQRLSAADVKRKLDELDAYVNVILKANEPTVLPEGSFEKIAEIGGLSYTDWRGNAQPYLTPAEMAALKLPRGSLTAEERDEIERHVVHTYNFLENIPWGRKLSGVPIIAGSHHEKLDGSGYPRQLRGDEIRVESRMMTISDIFDALTASDRPYKKAVPLDKALDIIGFEVKQGKCDAELFQLFVDAKVWQRVLPQ